MLPNPILELGPIKVYMYGVMVALGILAAFGVLYGFGKKKKVALSDLDFVFYLAIVSIGVGMFSAMLFQAIYDYVETGVFDLGGGLTFIGGLIGAAVTATLGFVLFRKKFPRAFYDTIEIIPAAIACAHGFGRIGCFFAGCCYGIQTDGPLGVHFPQVPGRVLPTQLFESGFEFLIFGLMSWLFLKKNKRHNMSVYLIGYGCFRFLTEYIRDDARGEFVAGVTPSQFWSILMVVLGIAFFFVKFPEPAPAAEAEKETAEPEVETETEE